MKQKDNQEKLYMNHGDHINSIMPAEEFLKQHLAQVIHGAMPWQHAHTQVSIEDMQNQDTDVFSLRYGDGPLSMLTLIALYPKDKSFQFVSVYPMMEGQAIQVQIEDVIEWDNQLEATVLCSFKRFQFAFFAIDYYANKSLYKVGSRLCVDLASIGMKIKEGDHGFSFEKEQAVKFLANIGKKPEYDKNGEVEPIHFNLDNLVAYLAMDSKAPDEAQFQSPFSNFEEISFIGVDFFKGSISIHRLNEDDKDVEIRVPLYFRKDFLPDIREGEAVKGWLWMTGAISGKHEREMKEDEAIAQKHE